VTMTVRVPGMVGVPIVVMAVVVRGGVLHR